MDIYPPNPDLKPYTYRIDCLSNGMWYWGVRRPHRWPDDYMGSSSAKIPGTDRVRMKEDIEKYGIENFEKTILEFFDTYEEARDAEKDLIRPDLNDPMCYNGHCGGKFAAGEKHPMYGRTHTKETRKRLSETTRNHFKDPKNRKLQSKRARKRFEDPKQREMVRIAAIKRGKDPIQRARCSAQIRAQWNDPVIRERWIRKQKDRFKDPKERERMSKLTKAVPKKTCEYCGRKFSPGMYSRWHGEKCKNK